MALQEDTKELMKNVLNEYVKCGVIGVACDRAGVRRRTHFEWMEKHPKYKELYEEVKEKFVDGLEEVAVSRAKEKSDSLLMFLLKAERREKYGDKSDVNLAGQRNAAPIQLVFAEGMLNDDERRMLGGMPDATEEETQSTP